MSLTDLRQQLNTIDEQIVNLLDQRMKVTELVGEYKAQNNLPVVDFQRESEIIKTLQSKAQHPILQELINPLYQTLFSYVRASHILKKHHEQPFENIGIIGLGLIGGSIVKTLRYKNPGLTIYTLKKDSRNNRMAIEHGYISQSFKTMKELIQNVDLLILATSIDSIPTLAEEITNAHQNNQALTVIDIASVKGHITDVFRNYTTKQLQFVPTHPMAGSEKTGFENASVTMFANNRWIIAPHEKNIPETIQKVGQFLQYLGAKVIIKHPIEHDKEVAAISHFVFYLASYLFSFIANEKPEALRVAGPGFISTTRLASGNPAMHSEIYNSNKELIHACASRFLNFVEQNPIKEPFVTDFFQQIKLTRDKYLDSSKE